MAEEPTLPRLPFGAQVRIPKRVRLHRSSSPPISSDPPLFSSDDDPSADNYSGSRQKKKFRGPWYSQRPAEGTNNDIMSDEKRKPRTFQRKFDSAVWLGSDGTEADEDAEFPLPDLPSGSQQSLKLRLPLRSSQADRPSAIELVDTQIHLCLEHGREDIDLSSRSLDTLPNHILKQLRFFVSVPQTISEESYQPLMPKLKLFLSSNKFKRVPGEVCNLKSLNVLSFRSNKLIEIPSNLGKLRHLVELNVANNNLHYLPYEILNFVNKPGKLESLQIHPNPFYEPDLSHEPLVSESIPIAVRGWRGVPFSEIKWNSSYKCRSYVRFLSREGRLVKGPELPGDHSLFSSPPSKADLLDSSDSEILGDNSILVAPNNDIPLPPSTSFMSRAPSLLEVAVKTWLTTPQMPDLETYLGDEAPERLSRLLQDATTLREMEGGDRHCTICHRAFIVPRTEWIEWWEVSRAHNNKGLLVLASAASPLRQMENRRDQVESKIPFMRRGCSWSCVPEMIHQEGNMDVDCS